MVSGGDSDEEDDDDGAKGGERNEIFAHSGAQVSRIDLTQLDEDDGYEVVRRENGQRRGPVAASGRHQQEGSSLSSKAGIILVRGPFLLLCHLFLD